MTEIALKCIASYLLGSVMGGLLLGRFRGVDIRNLGSGNAGGTNALRTQGALFALGVMLIDIGKGFLATRIIALLAVPGIAPSPEEWREWIPMICGVAVILGHIYPIWYGFRGGKGVATLIGVLLGLEIWLLIPMLVTWLVVVALSGYVGLASMAAAVSLPAYIAASGYEPQRAWLVFGIVIAALIVVTHRPNIARMKTGREPRARRLWLMGRGRG